MSDAPNPMSRGISCLYMNTQDVLYADMDPRAQLYSRQQIATLTSVDDSTLNYWTREGVLRAASGGGGKGQHRRFAFPEVNVALIFGQLKTFGVSLPALRQLSDRFHEALAYMDGLGVTRENEELFSTIIRAKAEFDRDGFVLHWIGSGSCESLAVHAPWVLELERHQPDRSGTGFYVRFTFEQEIAFINIAHLVFGREPEELVTPAHVSAATGADREEYQRHNKYWTVATTLNRKAPSEDFSTSPYAFYRDAAGTWHLGNDVSGLPAATPSFIGIDIELLSYSAWTTA